MTLVAAVFLLLAILLLITSLWELNWLIVISAVLGIVLLEYDHYLEYKMLDYLSYAFYAWCISILYYFVESHRISRKSISDIFSRNEFKQYLLDENIFLGYPKNIYHIPMIASIILIIFVFSYYAFNSSEYHQILDFFKNWSDYPDTTF